MVKELLAYRKGSLRIRVTGGSYDRFLNLCAHHGIALWNLEYCDGAYEMEISLEGFRMLRPLARKSSTKIRILKRNGLPFFLYRYRRRKLLFAGIAAGMLLMFVLSRFLWSIEIEGNQKITDGRILRYLEEVQVVNGTRLSAIDCKKLAADLRKEFEDVIWVSVRQEGTRLSIQIQENTDVRTAAKEETDTPADLVSDKNGVIVSMITRKGMPQTSVGKTIKKGDVLVKGVLDILDDSGEVTGHQFCRSDADILVKTTYQYRDEIPVTRMQKQYTGRKKTGYCLKVGGSRLALPVRTTEYACFDTVQEIRQLCFFQNFCLPVSLERTEYLEYEKVKVTLGQKEAVSEAEEHLYKFFTKIQEKGVQIFENNVKIEADEKSCVAKGSVILIENAGKRVERTAAE